MEFYLEMKKLLRTVCSERGSNRKRKHHVFDFRQFFSRLEVSPAIYIPVRQAAETVTLNDGNVLDGGVFSAAEAVFVVACGDVAHGLRYGISVPHCIWQTVGFHGSKGVAAQSSPGSNSQTLIALVPL